MNNWLFKLIVFLLTADLLMVLLLLKMNKKYKDIKERVDFLSDLVKGVLK
ncbi:hypothetical protein [Peptostreptococcus equinus]|uniref:Uncharacterized protein n=1 Tax=Peptostreptococcus equinus TaxID=3003601 RepID=A0ABY7JQ03_9FIRM|nr:hypothetical protein [Peptostreptococcus sp. CBA3647]WAW15430.1 hypothetical protein O0R46_03010 [Peptostreptococcus sp. CBA3647]